MEERSGKNGEVDQKIEKIKAVIRGRHRALDQRQNGDAANINAIHQIEEILGMPWRQGQAGES